MLSFLMKWSRTIMVIGIVVIAVSGWQTVQVPDGNIFESIPFFIGAALYILGRIFAQMDINARKSRR